MKRISVLMLSLMASVSASAAHVTMTTPAVNGETSYSINSQNHNVFKNFVKDQVVQIHEASLGLVTAEENGGHELIYLGAHSTVGFNDSNNPQNRVEVNLNNLNPDNSSGQPGLTDDVSLVLSAAESLSWDISIEDNIDLNAIFVFSTNTQSLIINDESVSLASNSVVYEGINIEVSPELVCGYALPDEGEGCHTDRILGFSIDFFDDEGNQQETNELLVNYLDELTDLGVTSFNGSYKVDGFDVGIDSSAAVVPIQGGLVLYTSAIAMLTLSRRKHKL